MTDIYIIGGKKIRIQSLFDNIHRYCELYRVKDEEAPENTDLTVSIIQEDLEYERKQFLRMAIHENLESNICSEECLEGLAVYRKIAEWMPSQDTFLFHGSAVAVDGQGYLFTAKSGTGKSTHTRLWREMLGERAVMINDDKPLIHVNTDGSAVIYGTPWNGKHNLGNNIVVPLKAICILKRDSENHIERIQKNEAYPMLLQQSYRPADPVAMVQTLQLIERINTAFYRLGCNMDPEAARTAYEGMKE